MKGGMFRKVKRPSGFTGKKPGDRVSSIYGTPDEGKSAKKPASPSAKSDKSSEKPAPKAAKKPPKKGGILALGISSDPDPEIESGDAGLMPHAAEMDAPDMPEPGMGDMGGGKSGMGGGMGDTGLPHGLEEGDGDAVKRFLVDALLEKLTRLQR